MDHWRSWARRHTKKGASLSDCRGSHERRPALRSPLHIHTREDYAIGSLTHFSRSWLSTSSWKESVALHTQKRIRGFTAFRNVREKNYFTASVLCTFFKESAAWPIMTIGRDSKFEFGQRQRRHDPSSFLSVSGGKVPGVALPRLSARTPSSRSSSSSPSRQPVRHLMLSAPALSHRSRRYRRRLATHWQPRPRARPWRQSRQTALRELQREFNNLLRTNNLTNRNRYNSKKNNTKLSSTISPVEIPASCDQTIARGFGDEETAFITTTARSVAARRCEPIPHKAPTIDGSTEK